jgi:hypothetical protein
MDRSQIENIARKYVNRAKIKTLNKHRKRIHSIKAKQLSAQEFADQYNAILDVIEELAQDDDIQIGTGVGYGALRKMQKAAEKGIAYYVKLINMAAEMELPKKDIDNFKKGLALSQKILGEVNDFYNNVVLEAEHILYIATYWDRMDPDFASSMEDLGKHFGFETE